LSIENEQDLINLLNSWGVFKREYKSVFNTSGLTGGYPLAKIVIHLTDVEQSGNKYKDDTGIYLSSFTKIGPNRFDVFIHVSSQKLTDERKKEWGGIVQIGVINTLYKLVNPVNTPEEYRERDKNIDEILKKLNSENKNYFIVIKK
jgi:hypothetical protein